MGCPSTASQHTNRIWQRQPASTEQGKEKVTALRRNMLSNPCAVATNRHPRNFMAPIGLAVANSQQEPLSLIVDVRRAFTGICVILPDQVWYSRPTDHWAHDAGVSHKPLPTSHLCECCHYQHLLARRLLLPGNVRFALSKHPRGITTMTASRLYASKNETLPNDVVDLETAVAQLPAEHRARIVPLMNRVVESTWRRRRILSLVQEALGQLRLDMKYLMFDLEATRRERDALQRDLNHEQQEEPGYDDYEWGDEEPDHEV